MRLVVIILMVAVSISVQGQTDISVDSRDGKQYKTVQIVIISGSKYK